MEEDSSGLPAPYVLPSTHYVYHPTDQCHLIDVSRSTVRASLLGSLLRCPPELTNASRSILAGCSKDVACLRLGCCHSPVRVFVIQALPLTCVGYSLFFQVILRIVAKIRPYVPWS